MDNLRKRGDRLAFKNDQELASDETMTPTLEATIVLWTLERIEPRLPLKVKKNYGHQMVGNNCIVFLLPTIFQNIGAVIAELDAAETACGARCNRQPSNFNLIKAKRQERAPKPSYRGRQANYSSGQRQQAKPRQFCRLCYHAGAAPSAYSSHTISACTY